MDGSLETIPFSKEQKRLIYPIIFSSNFQQINNFKSLEKEDEQDQAVNHKGKLYSGSCSRSSCWVGRLAWGRFRVKRKMTYLKIQGILVPSKSPILQLVHLFIESHVRYVRHVSWKKWDHLGLLLTIPQPPNSRCKALSYRCKPTLSTRRRSETSKVVLSTTQMSL